MITFRAETEAELYYFKKVKVMMAEIKLLKQDKGKLQANVNEIEYKLSEIREKSRIPKKVNDKLRKQRLQIEQLQNQNTSLKRKTNNLNIQMDNKNKSIRRKYINRKELLGLIEKELAEIPKLQDFASRQGDAEGYAQLCGQLVVLNRLLKKLQKMCI